MYGTLSLEQNRQGSYDLVIRYNRHDMEFAMDFFSKSNLTESYRTISDYLSRYAEGLKVRRAKIIAGSLVVAMLPLHMLLPASAAGDRYGSAYLYAGTQKQQLQYVQQAQGALDTVSPSYFDIASNGGLQFNDPGASMVESFHGMGIRVVPFISNHWDRQAGIAALENREEITDEIAALVEEYDFDGVNVDLENLTPEQRDDYTDFASLLREKLPAEKEVSVAVAANPMGWTWGWHASYDYEGLGEFSDYLTLMAYDEHYQGGEEGPVASIRFVENAILYALDHVEEDQVVVGLPLFGRIWGGDGYFEGHSIPLSLVDELIETYDALVMFDEDAQSPKASFVVYPDDPKLSVNGRTLRAGTYTLWFENERSIASKLELVDSYELKGACFWQLGQQSDTVWDIYQSWKGGGPYEPDTEIPDTEEPDIDSKDTDESGEGMPDPSQPPDGSTSSGSGSGTGTRPSPSRPSGSGSGGGGGGGGRSGGGGSSIFSPAAASTPTVAVNSPAATLQQTAVIKGENTILRSGAGVSSGIIQTVQPGGIVTVLSSHDGWYRVQLATGITGYLPAEQLSVHKAAVVTPASGATVYSAPVMADQAIALLPSGTALTILEEYDNGWIKVRLADKRVGYMSSMAAARLSFTREINIRTTTAALRLRDSASADAAVFGTVPADTQVQILDPSAPGYTKISYGSTIAFVSNGYLK